MSAYAINGPMSISFSGGRTSAFMLHRFLEVHGGLPDGVQICFCNTGKERKETLDFVHECADRWRVPVVWLEWVDAKDKADRFRVVDHASAARSGGPFEALIRKKGFTPNPVARLCTQHLKVYTLHAYLKSLGWEEWDSLIGIRHDEPRRWKIKGPDPRAPFDNRRLPLVEERVSEQDVLRFWARQPFDLGLQPWEGNCDLCCLKGVRKLRRLVHDDPESADWWIRMESETVPFRTDRETYAAMKRNAKAQPLLPIFSDEEGDTIPCLCTD